MKISNREMTLLWLVGLVILIAISLWLCSPKIKTWMELNKNKETVIQRIQMAQHRVDQREQWNKRLQDVARKLTKYPAEQDVTADYLKILENVVKENGVALSSRTPQKEKKHKELYELAVDCQWEANLDSLVRFLFAVGKQNVTMDIGDLNVSYIEGGKGKLKGTFSLICLYTRTGVLPQTGKDAPVESKKK